MISSQTTLLQAEKWKNAMIGSVIGDKPRFYKMEKIVLHRLADLGLLSMHVVKQNMFAFKFSSAEARSHVMMNGPYFFNNKAACP